MTADYKKKQLDRSIKPVIDFLLNFFFCSFEFVKTLINIL